MVNVSYALEKNVFLLLLGGVSYKYQLGQTDSVVQVFYTWCLPILLIIKRGLMRYSILNVDLSVFPSVLRVFAPCILSFVIGYIHI